MKNTMKKLLSLILVAIMFVTIVPMAYADGNTYKVGDIVQFGSYPQSKVTDSAIISALNSKAPAWDNWISYGYYSSESYSTSGRTQGDWMRYADVTYNGNKYRGVKFTQYRPYNTNHPSTLINYSKQAGNGYNINTVYWFKFEPIDWRVLDPVTGLVMSETIIDSQPYSNTIYNNTSVSDSFNDASYTNYANDYETSSIRQWLNDDFYNTAFTDSEKKEINSTTLNNDGFWTIVGNTGHEKLDSNSTNDKIFLLSFDEVKNNKFGFNSSADANDPARVAQGSDYAQSQGLYVYRNYSNWLLRSSGIVSYYCCSVHPDGYSDIQHLVNYASSGVRPALKLKWISDISQSGNPSEEPEEEPNFLKKLLERIRNFLDDLIDKLFGWLK